MGINCNRRSSMIKVSVRTVDGGLQEFDEPNSIFARLAALRHDGYVGKKLIHKLLTDDWGPPPVGVRIWGKLENGTSVDEYIPYE